MCSCNFPTLREPGEGAVCGGVRGRVQERWEQVGRWSCRRLGSGRPGLPLGRLFSTQVTAEAAEEMAGQQGTCAGAAATRQLWRLRSESRADGLLSLLITSCRRKHPHPHPTTTTVLGSMRHRRTSVAQVLEGLESPFPQNYISTPSFSVKPSPYACPRVT